MKLQPAPGYVGLLAANTKLSNLHTIDLKGDIGPEHIVIGPDGVSITGAMVKMNSGGSPGSGSGRTCVPLRWLSRLIRLGAGTNATPLAAAEPSLTIYNQNFAVVRDTVPLDLKAGVTEARFSGMTAMAAPDQLPLLEQDRSNATQISLARAR